MLLRAALCTLLVTAALGDALAVAGPLPTVPQPGADLSLAMTPAWFATAPASFRFSLQEGALAGNDAEQVVRIGYPPGIQGAATAPAAPPGWHVTRYVPDGAPATLELTAVASQQVVDAMAIDLGVLPFTCSSAYEEFVWSVRVSSATAGATEPAELVTACDTVPPVLVSSTQHLLASVRMGSVVLSADVEDAPVASAPVAVNVTLTPPPGAPAAPQPLTAGSFTKTLSSGNGGIWRYHFVATDAAGNALRIPGEGEFYLNVSEPFASATITGEANGAWHNASPTVAFSLSDAGSTDSTMNWSIVSTPTGAAPTPSAGEGAGSVVLGTGEHAIHLRSVDARGQASSNPAVTIKVDLTRPAATPAYNATPSGAGWFPVLANVTTAFAAGPSGLATSAWSVNGTPASGPVNLTTEGVHLLQWHATSVAGLVGNGSVPIRIDLTPPTAAVSATSASGAGASGLFRGTVMVSATASDALSEVASTTLTIDGVTLPYVAPRVVEGDGEHTATVRVVDNAGHATTATTTFRIDDAPPSLAILLNETPGATVANESGALRVDIVDDSTVTPACTLDGVAIDLLATKIVEESGWHVAECAATDAAGNARSAVQLVFYVDEDAPAIADLGDLGPSKAPRFQNTASDPSGLSVLQARYVDADGFAYAQPLADAQPAPLATLPSGRYALELRAVDVFGHATGWTEALRFDLATEAPTLVVDASVDGDAWAPEVIYTWALPAHAVPARVEVDIDGGGFALTESPFRLAVDGVHQVAFRAADDAGNVGESVTFTPRIDGTAPSLVGILPSAVYTNEESFSWTPIPLQDGGSPVDVELAIDRTPSPGVALAAEGVYALAYRAVDAAGNGGPLAETTLVIDRTAPVALPSDAVRNTARGALAWTAEDISPVSLISARLVLADGTEGLLDGLSETGATFEGVPEGEHAFEVAFQDEAGNVGDAGWGALVVDLTAPEVSLRASEWANGAYEVEVSGDDALSGVAAVTLVLAHGGEVTAWERGSSDAAFDVSVERDAKLTALARDAAGNVATSEARLVRFDDRKPQLTPLVEADGGTRAIAEDDRGDVEMSYRLCGVVCTGGTPYDGRRFYVQESYWAIEFTARDEAGNTARETVPLRLSANDDAARSDSGGSDERSTEDVAERQTDEKDAAASQDASAPAPRLLRMLTARGAAADLVETEDGLALRVGDTLEPVIEIAAVAGAARAELDAAIVRIQIPPAEGWRLVRVDDPRPDSDLVAVTDPVGVLAPFWREGGSLYLLTDADVVEARYPVARLTARASAAESAPGVWRVAAAAQGADGAPTLSLLEGDQVVAVAATEDAAFTVPLGESPRELVVVAEDALGRTSRATVTLPALPAPEPHPLESTSVGPGEGLTGAEKGTPAAGALLALGALALVAVSLRRRR